MTDILPSTPVEYALPWWLSELRQARYDVRRLPPDRREVILADMRKRGIYAGSGDFIR